MTNIETPEGLFLDGENITEILKGNQKKHGPVFTMRGNNIYTVRHGDWKLFLRTPSFYKSINPTTWVDKRAPDGITIIAPKEQATPTQYPGIRPEWVKGHRFLFNLTEDISEMKSQYRSKPEIVQELEEYYFDFLYSLDQ